MKRQLVERMLAVCLVASPMLFGAAIRAETRRHTAGKETHVEMLHAGPIRLKFAEGELRYLMVGDKEIARRIYFAVRDREWDTIMPTLKHCRVEKKSNGFTIDIDAECRRGDIDYLWQGRIVGTPEGELVFHARGKAGGDFASNRIGICLLYGSGSLAGQTFETTRLDHSVTQGAFPQDVSPKLVADNFTELRYTTSTGMQVVAAMTGAHFDMEDQRNYGDSSYKAYAPLVYPYPKIANGAAAEQTLTLQVHHADAAAHLDADGPIHIDVGEVEGEGKVPRVVTGADPQEPCLDFGGVNFNRSQFTAAKTLSWGLCPTVHLWDDDNLIDNLSAMPDQVRTAHTYAPGAPVRIKPVRLDPPHPRPERDPRNAALFGAAWSAAVLKYLALAGVEEATFQIGPGPAQKVQNAVGAYAGKTLRAVKIAHHGPTQVEAFTIQGEAPTLWLINLTAENRPIVLQNVPSNLPATLYRYRAEGDPAKETASTPTRDLALTLAPYEVVELQP